MEKVSEILETTKFYALITLLVSTIIAIIVTYIWVLVQIFKFNIILGFAASIVIGAVLVVLACVLTINELEKEREYEDRMLDEQLEEMKRIRTERRVPKK